MKKMTEMEALCEVIVLELIEIKTHLCNRRELEGGVGLGGLINSLLYRKDQEESKRTRNEKVQDEDEDEECEESSEEESNSEYWRSCHSKSEEDLEECRESMRDALYENSKLRKELVSLKSLIKKLFNADQIHPNQREEVRQELLKCDDVMDGIDGRLTDKRE
jgi:hypothetical protein